MAGRPATVIGSVRHPAIQRLKALERDRARRDREGVLVAWGLHLLAEALDAGAPIREAYAGPALEASEEGRALARRLAAAGTVPARVADRVLDAIAPGSGDQGVLLLIARPVRDAAAILRARPNLAVALYGVQDPGNLGGILRTAWALGADAAVALEGCADPFGSRAVRAGMGAHFRLPIARARARDWTSGAAAAGLRIVAADPGAGTAPERVNLRPPAILLLGGEGGGLPPGLLEGAAARVRIPMTRAASSLNVLAAAAVLLYEAARQRDGPG